MLYKEAGTDDARAHRPADDPICGVAVLSCLIRNDVEFQ